MLKVTGTAYEIITNALKKEKNSPNEHLFVRLSMGIGWGGPQLKLSLEERPLSEDQQVEFEDIQFLIHNRDLVYFEQTKLDYVTDPFGNGRFKLIKT